MADFTNSPSPTDAAATRRTSAGTLPAPPPPPEIDGDAGEFDPTLPWNADNALRREMDRLQASRDFAEVEAQLSGARPAPDQFRSGSYASLDPLAAADARSGRGLKSTPIPGVFSEPGYSGRHFAANGSSTDEVARLRTENEELNRLVDEMKQIFAQAAHQEAEQGAALATANAAVAERNELLQQQTDQIELLSLQIHELEQHIQAGVAPPPTEDELSKMADELEKERCQLTRDRTTMDEERNQLREDEEDMMRQMREMEVQMAKERADLARQRTEVQRLHSEVKHELDQMQNNRALTDRLAQFQRRHQEVLNRSSNASVPVPAAVTAPEPQPATNGQAKDGGLLGRFFGRK